jgi:hypothetical protein
VTAVEEDAGDFGFILAVFPVIAFHLLFHFLSDFALSHPTQGLFSYQATSHLLPSLFQNSSLAILLAFFKAVS